MRRAQELADGAEWSEPADDPCEPARARLGAAQRRAGDTATAVDVAEERLLRLLSAEIAGDYGAAIQQRRQRAVIAMHAAIAQLADVARELSAASSAAAWARDWREGRPTAVAPSTKPLPVNLLPELSAWAEQVTEVNPRGQYRRAIAADGSIIPTSSEREPVSA